MSRRIIPEISGYTKVQVVSFLKMKIKSDKNWAIMACKALYNKQTDKEKKNHISNGHNSWGFSRNDSPLLSHIACRINQNRATEDEIEMLQRRLGRYSGQLICIADDKDKCKILKKQLDYYYRDQKNKMPF